MKEFLTLFLYAISMNADDTFRSCFLVRIIFSSVLIFCFHGSFAQDPAKGKNSGNLGVLLAKAAGTSPDSAIGLYERAIKLGDLERKAEAKTGGKTIRTQLVKAHLGLGLVLYQGLEYDKAMQHYIQALEIANELKDLKLVGESQFNIAEVFLEQSHYAEAMQKYQEAREQYRLAGDQEGVFWCFLGMGIAQKQMGNLGDAVLCYNKALEVAQKAGMKNEVASSYNNLGNVYRKEGNFAKAMESYEKAISHFKALKNDIMVSDCQNNIGNLYLDNGDPFRALDYYNQSLKIAKEAKDEYRLIIRYKNIADAYTGLKDYDNAGQFLDDAMKLAQKSGDKSFLASCYMQSGKLQSLKKEPEIALAYYQKSANLFAQIGSRTDEADALVEIAQIELQNGNPAASIGHASKAEQLALQTGTLKTRLDAVLCLADGYERKGDRDRSSLYLRTALQLKDSIYTADKYRTIEEIEAGFVKDELKQQNSVLSQNSELQKQRIRTRNIILLLMALCLGLSAAVIRLIYQRQKKARQEARIVKTQSEQTIGKLSEDLTTKERELTSKTIFINQKNQLLERLIGELDELKKTDSAGNVAQHIQQQLKQELSPNAWKEFEVQFNEVHPGFQSRLLESFPELTPAERRLCSFIRLDMNTREISSLTGQSTKSIEVARTRIRKKLNVPHEHNLANFIARL